MKDWNPACTGWRDCRRGARGLRRFAPGLAEILRGLPSGGGDLSRRDAAKYMDSSA